MRVYHPHQHSPKLNQIPMSPIAATANYRKFGKCLGHSRSENHIPITPFLGRNPGSERKRRSFRVTRETGATRLVIGLTES